MPKNVIHEENKFDLLKNVIEFDIYIYEEKADSFGHTFELLIFLKFPERSYHTQDTAKYKYDKLQSLYSLRFLDLAHILIICF